MIDHKRCSFAEVPLHCATAATQQPVFSPHHLLLLYCCNPADATQPGCVTTAAPPTSCSGCRYHHITHSSHHVTIMLCYKRPTTAVPALAARKPLAGCANKVPYLWTPAAAASLNCHRGKHHLAEQSAPQLLPQASCDHQMMSM
jgi:hypothetical protein